MLNDIEKDPMPRWWKHLAAVTLILAIALVPRVFAIQRMVAPARDAFRYFNAARVIDQYGIVKGVPQLECHPLYPISLLATQKLYVLATGLNDPMSWLHAAQIHGVFWDVVFFLLTYAVGNLLWNQRVALWGVIAFSILPRQIFYSIDVLSDSLHAALWMSSFLAMVCWWNKPVFWKLAIAAVFAAMSYWTRIEAVLLPLTFLSGIFFTQLVGKFRLAWKPTFTGVVTYCAIYTLFVGAYMNLIGQFTPRNSGKAIIGAKTTNEPSTILTDPITAIDGQEIETPKRRRLAPKLHHETVSVASSEIGGKPNLIDRTFTEPEGYEDRTWSNAFARLAFEFAQETRFWLFAFMVYALLDRNRDKMKLPVGLLAILAFSGASVMLILVQVRAGYMAGRYLMPVFPFMAFAAVTGIQAGYRRAQKLPAFLWEKSWKPEVLLRRRVIASYGTIAALIGFLCVPPALVPLHGERVGHMQAAEWIRERTNASEAVFDPMLTTAFFAGRNLWVCDKGVDATGANTRQKPYRYAIIDPSIVYRVENPVHLEIKKVNEQGRVVQKFLRKPGSPKIGVYVFEMPTASSMEKQTSNDSAKNAAEREIGLR